MIIKPNYYSNVIVTIKKIVDRIKMTWYDSSGTEMGTVANPVITSVSGTVPLPTGSATAANQVLQLAQETIIAGDTTSIDGKITACDTTGLATEGSLAAINAKLVSGTDIGDVTVNNGTGAAAVNIQDGGNAITVDGQVSVDDGGGSITVDGEVKATAQISLRETVNYELTVADTEYSYALNVDCYSYEFWCRELEDIRWAYATGKVAGPTDPYYTLRAGETYYIDQDMTGTIYFASSVAGVTVEILQRGA